MKKFATPLACLILGLAILAPLVLIFGGFIPVSLRQVQLAVTFKLTDPDYHPLPGVPIRLLVCSDKGWQEPDAGYRFVTDANGEGHVTVPAVLDRRWRTMDSSYISFPMLTDHLAAGAEMEYMNFHWVYVVDSVLYPEGTTGLDHFSVYTRDAQGRFTRQAVETNEGWVIPDLDGKMISDPGYDPWDFSLAHDDAGQNWTLRLAFKKFPPAVQR